MKLIILSLALLLLSGCVAQKEAPPAPAPEVPSEPELASEVEEVIGIPEEATIPSETTGEIAAPNFEVSEPVDLGSVI